MKVVVTGGRGQLGRALQQAAPGAIDCIALDSQALDITDANAVTRTLAHLHPDCIINAAAYTAVDKAESEPEKAFAVNHQGVANVANSARVIDARLIHASTDYVFDGRASRPYQSGDEPNPLNVYGHSKLAGERAVQELLPPEQYLIMRTAWLYALPGKNFVATMLRLLNERPEVRVVCDQIGSPTAAAGLAAALWRAVERRTSGLHHWTDAGTASWYDFAVAVQTHAMAQRLLSHACAIVPINSAAFPTKAERPTFSILDKQDTWDSLSLRAQHWQDALGRTLANIDPELPLVERL